MRGISVIIPTVGRGTLGHTIQTINQQTLKPSEIIVTYGKTAPVARNQGAKIARYPLLLFSDDDIFWEPDAFKNLYTALRKSKAAYAYGSYDINRDGICRIGDRKFSKYALKKMNFISTMCMVRAETFPGFDESIKRLQDWDLWLTMLEQGHRGTFCGKKIFSTASCPNGITQNSISWTKAEKIIKKKHGL